MRLTAKQQDDISYGYSDEMAENIDRERMLLNNYGELEDIEEELGIKLTTLFKALKQEILFIKTDFDIRKTVKNGEGWGMKHLSFEDGEPIIFAQIWYPNDITHKEWLTPLRLKLQDYGRVWALTEEELL